MQDDEEEGEEKRIVMSTAYISVTRCEIKIGSNNSYSIFSVLWHIILISLGKFSLTIVIWEGRVTLRIMALLRTAIPKCPTPTPLQL